ncbi:MAG: metalloregulator ArsR/SmtB family transcription factor [Candidatus Krumholzibacteriia bacterium]
MTVESPAHYETRARVLKALGHPARLCIVDALADGPRSVGELQELVGTDLSTVSRHLGVLRGAGILSAERRGNQVLHTLRVRCVLDFFTCVDAVVTGRDRTWDLEART